MRRATDYENLDDDGEVEPSRYDLAHRRQRLEDVMSYLQLRYSRLGKALDRLAEEYERAEADAQERES